MNLPVDLLFLSIATPLAVAFVIALGLPFVMEKPQIDSLLTALADTLSESA